MSDCCKVPETSEAPDRCRECGATGRRVLEETMESLLKPEALGRKLDVPYYFDRTPGCNVVYFSNAEASYFMKDDLRVRVGIKETESPIPICYCFGHTAESAREEILITGQSTVAASITAEVQAGNCSCEVKNPSGKCCLGDVNRAIRQIQIELEELPVARSERG